MKPSHRLLVFAVGLGLLGIALFGLRRELDNPTLPLGGIGALVCGLFAFRLLALWVAQTARSTDHSLIQFLEKLRRTAAFEPLQRPE